jgi:regulator of RNase E activity RraA
MACCELAGVPCQQYSHRSDLGCGSTIGPIVAARLGMATVDVGSPMWAMHSARESAGAADPALHDRGPEGRLQRLKGRSMGIDPLPLDDGDRSYPVRRHHGDADHGAAQEGPAQCLDARRAAACGAPVARLVGRAFTCASCRRARTWQRRLPGVRRFLHAGAIEAMPAGCIAVVDAMGVTDAGIFGDILCSRMMKRGVTALVTDGVVRDIEGVLGTQLPVWCQGTAAPASVAGLTFVGWQEPIGCGGVAVFPNDIVVADADGAVLIPAALLDFTKELDLDPAAGLVDAKRGFIARPSGKIVADDGTLLHDFDAYAFVDGKAPATVNPSLWRHAIMNAQAGLFKVTEGIYQLRGFDLANITLVEGKTGWIVIDALTARESASAAMAFANRHLGPRPVSALIFTHSHVDHFGGALGVVSAAEAARRKLPVIASEGFLEEATSENVLVGTAMARRSIYQFGKNLERSAKGNVDTGLGKNVVYGAVGILPPNLIIDKPTQEVTVDGVRFIFHNVPGAEAPAEMTFAIPERRPTAVPRTWRRPCTTCCRCAAPSCATRCAGPTTCSRRWTNWAMPRCISASTTGRSGGASGLPISSPGTATSTNTPTTRRCA